MSLSAMSHTADSVATLSDSFALSILPLREANLSVGQEKESVPVATRSLLSSFPSQEKELSIDTIKLGITSEAWKPKSSRALLWSILPGGGQIYNRKYWKLPIVWGAFLTTFYAIRFNQRMYNDYHNAYRDIMSPDPSKNTAWLSFTPVGTRPEDFAQYDRLKSMLKRGNDYYRRYRDISIVAGVLVYALSALDAYVDAELFTFDISQDLTMQLCPQVSPVYTFSNSPLQPQLGLLCSLSF